jgi:hypothetical protein
MLAMALQADVAQQDDLVVAVGLLEGALQQGNGIDAVAGEELLILADDPAGRVDQALARGIVAGPAQQGADGLLGLFTCRSVGRACGFRSEAGSGPDDVHRAGSFRTDSARRGADS